MGTTVTSLPEVTNMADTMATGKITTPWEIAMVETTMDSKNDQAAVITRTLVTAATETTAAKINGVNTTKRKRMTQRNAVHFKKKKNTRSCKSIRQPKRRLLLWKLN